MIKGINRVPAFALIVLGSLISSCNSRNVMFTDNEVMPDITWNLLNNPVFRVDIKDTAAAADLFFNIRTGSDYPYRNIWLFVTTTAPDGNSITDTLQYNLADEKGNWYGKGPGDIHELDLPYKKNVYFPAKGSYQIKIQHGMRTGELRGVYDIGIRVEKSIR